MKTKEQIIQRMKEDIEGLATANNEKYELVFLNDLRVMIWILE